MPRLPQEILRQRTRQDLLRQRQAELKRKIEQPTPEQPQATQQEREEYERLTQQYEQQQEKLQSTISDVENQMAVNLANFQAIKESIRQKQAANPEYTSGVDTRRANEYANRYEDLKVRLGHLKASGSIEEASLFGSYYKGRRAEELGRQAAQRLQVQPQIPTSPVSEMYEQEVKTYQKQGFSKSEAEYLATRGAQEQVTYLPEGAKRIIQERPIIEQDIKTYRKFGFTGVQAQFLAEKGAEQQVTFTKEGARRIIQERTYGIWGGALAYPTREGERLVRKQLEKTLPGRYQLARMEKMERVVEGEFNVYETISEAYWKTSEFLAEKTIDAFKKVGIPTSLLEKEIKLPGWVKDIPGHLAVWILFSPAMGSGVAAQELMYAGRTKLVYDYVKKKWVRVDAATGKAIPEMTRAEALGEFGRLSEERQLQILRKAFKNVKDESGNILKRVYLDKASLLKDIEKAKDFMRNAGLSEAQIEARINLLFPKLKPRPPTQIQAEIQAEMPQQLVGIDWLGAGTSVVQAEAVGQVQFQQFRQPQLLGLGLRSELAQRQAQLLRQRQLFFQAQVPRLAQPQIPRLAQPQIPILRAPQIPRVPRPRVPRPRVPRSIPRPIPRPIPIPRLSEASIEKVKKALAKLKGKSVNVMVGMEKKKQKVIYKDLPPRKAYMKAQEFVDRNIQASFRIVPTGKKTKKKDIKKIMFSGKFRPSKREPLFQVEKRKYRLDMPGEKKQIKRAKRGK